VNLQTIPLVWEKSMDHEIDFERGSLRWWGIREGTHFCALHTVSLAVKEPVRAAATKPTVARTAKVKVAKRMMD